MSENEGRHWTEDWAARMEEQRVIDKLSGKSGADGEEPSTPDFGFLRDEVREAWGAAIRAFNSAQNQNALDTAQTLGKVVISLSQDLEFLEAMSPRVVSQSPITEQGSPRFLHEIEDFPKVVEILRSTLDWLEKLRDEGESMRNELYEPDYLSEIKEIIHVARVNAKSSGVDLS